MIRGVFGYVLSDHLCTMINKSTGNGVLLDALNVMDCSFYVHDASATSTLAGDIHKNENMD